MHFHRNVNKNFKGAYNFGRQSTSTLPRNDLLCQLLGGLGSNEYKMKVWHPWQLKKAKSWGPFWSYQLNSTANSAYAPQKWAKWAELAVLFCW